jgi:hypothetical protein
MPAARKDTLACLQPPVVRTYTLGEAVPSNGQLLPFGCLCRMSEKGPGRRRCRQKPDRVSDFSCGQNGGNSADDRRPPKPTHVLKLQGTYRPHRHGNRPEPAALPPLGEPPDWVTGTEGMLAIWRNLTAHAPHLRAGDRRQVCTLCLAAYLWERDRTALLEYAAESPPSLHARVLTGARMIMALSKELGLTPLGRARIAMEAAPKAPEEPDPDDTWGRLKSFSILRGGRVE